jgi:hypothetical protein
MKLAVMQPYFFPYIGYFQLINSVDKFIFYDDVNFIKNGWINRNRILINNEPHYITIQLKNASSFKTITSVKFGDNINKIKKTIELAYKKSPCFNEVWPIVEDCLDLQTDKISELAIYSVLTISKYIGINTIFENSSKYYSETSGLERTERLLKICKLNNANEYINPIGGSELYNKEDFKSNGINLHFIKMKNIRYIQQCKEFVPNLSIIDVLMFNSSLSIKKLLDDYDLV